MNNVKTIVECEVCHNSSLSSVLDLGKHPLCDDLKPIGSLEKSLEYPIEILFCETCKTAHQKYQVNKELLFPPSYHYRSSLTVDVLKGMRDLVTSCLNQLGSFVDKTILDIGCNDGSLLKFFKEQEALTIGVEPTNAADTAKERLDNIYKEYFTIELAKRLVENHPRPDVITFTNVFAHIEDLNALIEALKVVLSEKTIIVIENHYLGSILEKNQFDSFYHEHPRTYSLHSFFYIADKLNLKIIQLEFPERYGGNIRVKLGPEHYTDPIKQKKIKELLESEMSFKKRFQEMNSFIVDWQNSKFREISSLVSEFGPIYAKAFPGRAAILIKLLKLDESMIQGIFEKNNSPKIGHYAPGTKIPIIPDESMESISPPVLLNLAWHIKDEIHQYLQMSYSGQIIDVL